MKMMFSRRSIYSSLFIIIIKFNFLSLRQEHYRENQMRIILYTMLALLAFAGNSILCRLALGENTIDAASFTLIRLTSGIIVLVIVMQIDRINLL